MDENLLNDLSEVEMPSLTLEMAPAAEEKPEAPKASAANRHQKVYNDPKLWRGQPKENC